jgi:hypothetical protein
VPNNGDKIAALDICSGHDGDFIAGFSADKVVRAVHCPHLCHQILLSGYPGARQHAYHHRHCAVRPPWRSGWPTVFISYSDGAATVARKNHPSVSKNGVTNA